MDRSQGHTILITIFVVIITSLSASAENNWCKKVIIKEPDILKECGGIINAIKLECTNKTKVPIFYPPAKNSTSNVCIIDLSHNDIHNVTNDAFVNVTQIKILYLSNNNLSYIQKFAFRGLTNLQYINMSMNSLTWPGGFDQNGTVFAPLTNLTNINIKSNPITSFEGLDEALLPMQKLEGLFIDGCKNCSFGPHFTKLTKLVNISLSPRTDGACEMPEISNETFENVPQIKGLWMSDCQIVHIDAGAFRNLEELRILDISYNRNLTFEGMNKALYGLRNHKHLYLLNVKLINELYGRGIELKEKHIKNLKTLQNLTKLHMDLNKIEVFDDKIIQPIYQLPNTLRTLTLGGNRLTYDKYLEHLHCVTNITYLDISRQHLSYDPFKFAHYEPEEHQLKTYASNGWPSTAIKMFIPSDLAIIHWRSSSFRIETIPDVYVVDGRHLVEMDISGNIILNGSGTIYGLQNLKRFYLSKNACQYISSNFFSKLTHLEILNISGNAFGNSLSEDVFGSLSNLHKLDISSNGIRDVPRIIFSKLLSLGYLYMAYNFLEDTDLDFSFDMATCLKVLDLSHNKLKELPLGLMQTLDKMATDNCPERVLVNLTGNPIECTCDTLDFLKWLLASNVHFEESDRCYMPGHGRPRLDNEQYVLKIINKLEKSCVNYTWLVLLCTVVGTGGATFIASKCFYKFRWKLRYLYYSGNRCLAHEGYHGLFEYDAFISYAPSLEWFIKKELVPVLESPKFDLKIWAAAKHMLAGSRAENIVNAINHSRKAVLLIDKHYLKDSWCDYEMNMARMESIESKRPMIIFVLFDNVSLSDLPASIFRSSYTEEHDLTYPDNDSQDELEQFWEKLYGAIRG